MHLTIKALLTGLLLLCSIHAFAGPVEKCILRGRVTDTASQPLPGAIIELPDLHTGAVSDAAGNYEIMNLPTGHYLVSVKLLGFATQARQVTISPVTTADFRLAETVLEQHEIIVTGTSAAGEQRRSTTPIQSISLKALQENASSNVIDAISRMPGISQISTGPAVSKPVIRGLGYSRIVTLNDGIRQEGQQWGDEHGIEIDDYNVARVEVLKGPASLAYGSDAIAGVINILSDEPPPAGTVRGKMDLNYQTNNGLGALHAQLAGRQGGVDWEVYGTEKKAHDYQNPFDGYVYDSRFSNTDFGASIGINKHWGASRIAFTSFNQQLGIAEGARDSATGRFIKAVNNNGTEGVSLVTDADGYSYDPAIPGQRINHQKITWVSNGYLNDGARLGLTLGYQQNTRQEFGDILRPDDPGLYLVLKTFSYDLHYLFPVSHGWQMTAGVNGMQQDNVNRGSEFLVPDYKLFDAGGYFIAKRDIGPWALSGGLRLDTRHMATESLYADSAGGRIPGPVPGGYVRFSAFSRTFAAPSGSLGISYAASKRITFKVNIAGGYRAPNIAELGANGVHEGTIRYEYGNPDLKAEHSIQADAGLEWSSEHVLVNAALFCNYIRNFVFIRKMTGAGGADSIPATNNPLDYPAFINGQTDARLYGGEVFVDLHPHPLDWLHFENTFSYVVGRTAFTADSEKYLPYVPPARWLIGLRAQGKTLGRHLRNGYVKVELDNYFRQNNVYAAYGTETASPGYALLDAGIGVDVTGKKGTLFTLTVAGQNLGDAAYQNHLSRLRYADVNNVTGRAGIFNMGRNVSVSVHVPLQFK